MLNTPQNRRSRKLKRVGLVIILLYIMFGSILYFFQEKMLFLPTRLPKDHVYEFTHDYEEFFLETKDKASINTLFFKAKNPIGAILYFHGNAGDLQRWGTIVSPLVDMNYDVYIMDYRTYGKSVGDLSEHAMYNDAVLCYEHLKNFWNDEDIIVYGRSLGSAMATYLASKVSFKHVILETPFYSIEDVAKNRFPIFPVKTLLKYKFPNNEYIDMVKSPITILHGTDDYVVPYSSAKKLFDVSPKKRTHFITIEGGGHNNLATFESYQTTLEKCLKN